TAPLPGGGAEQGAPSLNPWRPRNAQDPADPSNGSALDPRVPGNRCLGQVHGIEPNVVFAAMMVQDASLPAQLAFQLPAIHGALLSLRRGCRQPAEQLHPRLLESLSGIASVRKRLVDGFGLRNQLRVKRRSHDVTAFL